jgi:hypothetical protein
MSVINLALRRAMIDHTNRHEIFMKFIKDRLFDQSISDDEFLTGLETRQRAYEAATQRLLDQLATTRQGAGG